jgi:hypothetical protein
MRPPTPLQGKTPFEISSKPLAGITTSRAGLSAVSRVLRAINLPGMCEANLALKKRSRGFVPGQVAESLVLLHAAGGDCQGDMENLRQDSGLTKMLGYQVPSARCTGDFLALFHDEDIIRKAREAAEAQGKLAILPEESSPLCGLGRVVKGTVTSISRLEEEPIEKATIDQDATIIESHKRKAKVAYEGTRGYQPMVAVWAEADLIVADEFRDGNVPAQMAPLHCAKAAFAALPTTVSERFFRGDSACHENDLLGWLCEEDREDGPKGFIGFAVSARMSEDLIKAVKKVADRTWKSVGTDSNGTIRQWAEIDFVPGERSEKKTLLPLRYVGLRLVKPQGELFADGNQYHYHAVITNRVMDGGQLLNWHREKAGTIEHVHDEIKNGLGGGRLPSGNFGTNAAWFRFACIAYNILSALRRFWPDETLRNAKAKRLRFEIFNVTGRFTRDSRKITLRIAASVEWIKRLLNFFGLFKLVTRATG